MDLSGLFDVRDKTALVTGGSRGIGYMIAEGLLSVGARVFICARKIGELETATRKLREIGECVGIQADLSTAEGCLALSDAISRQTAQLDILINNAGITWGAKLDDYPREAFERVLAVNLTGPFELIRMLLPLLRKAARSSDPARIINLSSTAGLSPPGSDTFAYSTSKAGLVMLGRHLARRLAPEMITVNTIAPGAFPSRMTAPFMQPDGSQTQWSIPLGRMGRAQDIAGAVIFLSSAAGAYLTGALLPVSGGLTTAD
jgi:NAD(P)-dependent dehydrogenase (short-subunit alcohol dehydrogenase family)